jgi:hypothetical protein
LSASRLSRFISEKEPVRKEKICRYPPRHIGMIETVHVGIPDIIKERLEGGKPYRFEFCLTCMTVIKQIMVSAYLCIQLYSER